MGVGKDLQPMTYDRFSGWDGNAYSEALEFCKSQGSRSICPYESLCPNGLGEGQPIINLLDGPIWMAIDGIVDMWVEIHNHGQCTVQTNLDKFDDVTRYVLCCRTEDEQSSSTDNREDASSREKDNKDFDSLS